MKKLLIILTLLSFLYAFPSDKIYVYRNDGLFNAFFSAEIDSIKFSNIGVDGNEYSNAVTQEFFTNDSIYRIPLNVIDSISVYQPETIYKPNVRIITPEYYPYINSCKDMTIDFKNNIPASLEPKLNDILVSFEDNDVFKGGFCGQVVKLNKNTSLVAECDSVGFLEIYDQLISLDEYTIEPSESYNAKYKIISRSFEAQKGEIPLNIEIPITLGSDNVNVSGAFKIGFRFKVITNITPSTQYIEFGVIDRESFTLSVSGGVGKSDTKFKIHPEVFKIKQPIPQLPGFSVGVRFCPFTQWKLARKIEIETEGYSQNSHSFVWNNGKFASTSRDRQYNLDFSPSLSLEGSIWTGLYNRIELSSIGNLVSIGSNISIGPNIKANISADLHSLLSGDSAYKILKDSKVSACLKGGADFSFNFKWRSLKQNGIFSSFEEYSIPFGNFAPSMEFGKIELYLLPLFNTIESKTKGRSVHATSTANRSLLFPCQIGFTLTDKDNNALRKFNSDNYWIEGTSNNILDHIFDNLNYNTTYKLQPVIKILGFDINASPQKNISVGAFVDTGSASASYDSATTSCYYSFENESEDNQALDSYGICYSKSITNPDIISGQISNGTLNGEHWFINELTGLEEGTTYFYRGFISVGNQYIYGDARCFTTKKHEDPDDESNPGGDIDNGTPPVATTLGSFNVKQNSASVQLSFSNIVAGTECGYFLDVQTSSPSGGNNQMVSLGTVTGNITVPLSGLKPSTTYYYQAFARNSYGKSIGREMSFTTDPAPVPSVSTLRVFDVNQNSAKVECLYSNLPEDKRGGVEITSNDWSYALYQSISDGNRTFSISNLEPETSYSVCAFADYSEGTVYGNDISFTTKPREIPDLSGTWTFSQSYLGAKVVYPELKLKSKGSNYAIYTAGGFYGGITFEMTVYNNLSASIVLSSPYGYSGYFSGQFDEDFTSVSGSSYIYDFGPNNWAVPPVEIQEPWSLSR